MRGRSHWGLKSNLRKSEPSWPNDLKIQIIFATIFLMQEVLRLLIFRIDYKEQ